MCLWLKKIISYVVYSMITIIIVIALIAVYYIVTIRLRDDSKKLIQKPNNIHDTVEKTENSLNDDVDRIMNKGGAGSAAIYFGLCFVLLMFGVTIGCYIIEYFILFFHPNYVPLTNAENSNIIIVIIIMPLCLVNWLFIVAFFKGAVERIE